MNRIAAFTALFAATLSSASFASPALYTFSAPIYASEVNLDGSSIAAGDYLFGDEAAISGTFLYDAETGATSTDQPPLGLGPTGLVSFYNHSIQAISATVGGYSFGASSGGVLIGDANDDATLDSMFIRAGLFDNSAVGSGFSGFTLGNYTLVSFDLYTFSTAAAASSQALPAVLGNGEFVTAVSLIFADDSDNQRLVQFGLGNIELAEVPVPASAWLFGSAALVLFGRKRQRC